MGRAISVGKKSVVYTEVPPLGAGYGYRAFEVRVDGTPFVLSANSAGVVADGGDHPIVAAHPDVVKAIIAAEYPASGSANTEAPDEARVRKQMELVEHLHALAKKVPPTAESEARLRSAEDELAAMQGALGSRRP